jgi:hypothetical protein
MSCIAPAPVLVPAEIEDVDHPYVGGVIAALNGALAGVLPEGEVVSALGRARSDDRIQVLLTIWDRKSSESLMFLEKPIDEIPAFLADVRDWYHV